MRPGHTPVRPRAHCVAAALAVLCCTAPALAQQPPGGAIEIRPFVGTLQPLDDRARWFLGGTYTGVQLAAEFPQRVHLVSTIAWTYALNQFLAEEGTDVWHGELGFEWGPRRRVNDEWELHPLIGAGGGVRAYDYRAPGVTSSAHPAGYLSLAVELQTERVGLRGDARLIASGFRAPVTGERVTRRDATISVGISYHLAGPRRR